MVLLPSDSHARNYLLYKATMSSPAQDPADPLVAATRIQSRINAIQLRLESARTDPGLRPEDFTLRDTLVDRHRDLSNRFSLTWLVKVEQHEQDLFDRARGTTSSAEQTIKQLQAQVVNATSELEASRSRLAENPASAVGQASRLEQQAQAIAQLEERIEGARLTVAKGQQEMARINQARIANAREAAAVLPALREEVDALLSDTVALYERLQDRRQLTAADNVVTKNREEFAEARTYHRERAVNLLWGAVAVPFLLAALVVANLIWGEKLRLVTPEGHVDWPLVLLVFGGRISIVAALAWLVAFLGRLHARHSQQAVSYQNRLAALDIATMLLQHDRAEGRSATLRQMSAFYLTKGDNAFLGADPKELAPHDVEKWVKAVTGPMEGIVKALGRSDSKG
jgi:hypothetical protein